MTALDNTFFIGFRSVRVSAVFFYHVLKQKFQINSYQNSLCFSLKTEYLFYFFVFLVEEANLLDMRCFISPDLKVRAQIHSSPLNILMAHTRRVFN